MPVRPGWSINDVACGEPHSNTIVVVRAGSPGTASQLCTLGRARNVIDVELWRLRDPRQAGAFDRARTHSALDDGTPALIGHEPSDHPVHYTTTTLVVPSLHVVVIGNGPDRKKVDSILLRLTPIPTDRVVVPDLIGATRESATARLRSVGLGVRVVLTPHDNLPGRPVLRTQPPSGFAVAGGSVVTVSIDR